jgi:hypothetical protein
MKFFQTGLASAIACAETVPKRSGQPRYGTLIRVLPSKASGLSISSDSTAVGDEVVELMT